MKRLKNKTAIVTGGSHGLGRAISELFAQEGSTVFVFDIDEIAGADLVACVRKRDGEATFIRADVSSEEEVNRAVRMVSDKDQRIDILCNAASYATPWHSAIEASPSEWERSLAVSLMGAQYATRAVLPFMIRQKSGSIVNCSSVQGLVGGRNAVAEASVKSALLGFTRSVAYDYGVFGIRVNAVCAGPLRSLETTVERRGQAGEHLPGKTFLGRSGQPHEVTYAALFLASDEASYITGAVLPVDGGWTAM